MLNVKFFTLSSGEIVGIFCKGHCGYEKMGKDIVCAAVSSAIYMAINTFTDVLKIEPKKLNIRDGNLEFLIDKNDEYRGRILFEGLKIHLLGLEEIYPKNLKIDYVEV